MRNVLIFLLVCAAACAPVRPTATQPSDPVATVCGCTTGWDCMYGNFGCPGAGFTCEVTPYGWGTCLDDPARRPLPPPQQQPTRATATNAKTPGCTVADNGLDTICTCWTDYDCGLTDRCGNGNYCNGASYPDTMGTCISPLLAPPSSTLASR